MPTIFASGVMLSSPNRLRLLGLFAAVAAILWDQVTKLWILHTLADAPARHLEVARAGPVGLDLVLWWNRGISFGLLHLPQSSMPLILSAAAVLICAFLGVWLWRGAIETPNQWQSLALGLIIGGALGNVIDRLQHGAVVDFLYAYWGGHYWPAFNIADSCICIGVILLLLTGGLLGSRSKTA